MCTACSGSFIDPGSNGILGGGGFFDDSDHGVGILDGTSWSNKKNPEKIITFTGTNYSFDNGASSGTYTFDGNKDIKFKETRPKTKNYTGYYFNDDYPPYITVDFGNGNETYYKVISGGTDTKPAAPTGVNASVQSSTSIKISWSAVTGASGYYVYRNTSASGTYTQIRDTTSTSYTDSGLTTGTTYYYKVSAYNIKGESSQSAYVLATPTSSTPSYTVTFDSNGGIGTIAPITVHSGTSITLPDGSGFSKIDYTFGGWNTNSSGTGTTYGASASYPVTGGTTLYAIWNSSLSGGGTQANPFELIENTWTDGSITTGTTNREVWYSFDVTSGTTYYVWWNDSGNGEGDGTKTLNVKVTAYYSNNTTAFLETDSAYTTAKSFTAVQTGTVKIKVVPYYSGYTGTFAVLYNKIGTKPCIVTFDINGGTGTAPTQNPVTSGSYIQLPDGTGLSKDGYKFIGWNISSSGNDTSGNTLRYYNAYESYPIKNNITFYARWGSTAQGGESNPNLLTENTWTDGNITTGTPDREIWYSLDFTNETFYVWWIEYNNPANSDKTLNVKVTAYFDSGQIVNDGTGFFQDIDIAWNTAQSFNPSGYTTKIKLKVVPYYNGYTGTFAIVYNTSGTRPGIPNTVTFNLNDGIGTVPDPVTVNSGTNITLPDGSGLSRDGYRFAGWNTSADGTGTTYSAGDSYIVNGNVTLYAKWGSTLSGGEFNPILLNENTWTDGVITSSTPYKEVWYKFDVTGGTQYYVWWNDYNSGDGTKTLDVKVSAYYSNDTTAFSEIDSAWTNARSFTADQPGTVTIKVVPYYSNNNGTFAIVYSTNNKKPCIVTFNSNGGNGTIASITVNSGISITLPTGTGLTKPDYQFAGWNTLADGTGTTYNAGTSYPVNSNVTLYVKWGSTVSGGQFNPNQLTENTWADGNITSSTPNREVWYKFDVTNGTPYYIWWNDSKNGDGTKTLDVKVTAYYSNGANAFSETDSAWNSVKSFTANQNGTVTIKVVPYTSGDTGTFVIVYNTTNIKPCIVTFNNNDGTGTAPAPVTVNSGSSTTLPDGTGLSKNGYLFAGWNTLADGTGTTYSAGASFPVTDNVILYVKWGSTATGGQFNSIQLTPNTWADGNITTSTPNREIWYKFDVTNGTQYYVWWNDSKNGDGTKTLDVKVSAYYNNGTNAFSEETIDSAWNPAKSFTANQTGTVTVQVIPYNSGSTGTFAIVYNTTNIKPCIVTFNNNGGTGTIPARTVDSGSSIILPDENDLQKTGYVFLGWNDNPTGTGTIYINSYTVTSNVTLYAKWGSAVIGGEGNPILLTTDVWADGSITSSSDEIWYKFDVTNGTKYYVWWNDWMYGDETKTLYRVNVIAYYSDGTSIFSGDYHNDSAWKIPKSFTANQDGIVKLKTVSYSEGSTGTFALVYSTNNTRTCTVSFNSNGGTGIVPVSMTDNSGSNIILPDGSGLSKSDYYFSGWNTHTDGRGTNYSTGASYWINSNTTLYARWRSTLIGGEGNPIQLTENIWDDNEITPTTPDDEIWYSFDVTSGTTYYVWSNSRSSGDGTKTLYAAFNAYYSNGTQVITQTFSAWYSPQSFTAGQTGTVKLKVIGTSGTSGIGKTGTFAMVYSTSSTRPSN